MLKHLLVACVLLISCGGQARVPVLDCRMRLLQPYLGAQTERIVLDSISGNADIRSLLIALGLNAPQIIDLAVKWEQCKEMGIPQGNPS